MNDRPPLDESRLKALLLGKSAPTPEEATALHTWLGSQIPISTPVADLYGSFLESRPADAPLAPAIEEFSEVLRDQGAVVFDGVAYGMRLNG